MSNIYFTKTNSTGIVEENDGEDDYKDNSNIIKNSSELVDFFHNFRNFVSSLDFTHPLDNDRILQIDFENFINSKLSE